MAWVCQLCCLRDEAGRVYFTVGSLIVCWDVTRGIFDLERQSIYAGQAVVYSIVAFTSSASGREAVQTLHLLLKCWKGQLRYQ